MSPMDFTWATSRPATERTAPRAFSRDGVHMAARTPVRSGSRAEARDRESGVRSTDRDRTDASDSSRRVSKAEFSALLALLAGAGSTVRHDLIGQLPEDAASLVDRLLEDGIPEADTMAETSSSDAPTSIAAGAASAGEALHYGLLTLTTGDGRASDAVHPMDSARSPQHASPSGDESAPSAGDATGTASPSVADDLHNIGLQDGGSQRTRMLDALSRVSSRRGASVEQLLALGDAKGADARAALDALLAQAGTPSGARLAARAIMSRTNASLLGASDDALATASLDARRALPGDPAALVAAANGATHAARSSNGALDVGMAEKAMHGLDPDLRARVDRVIERMRDEYGHDVTIVETVRSQERQDWLYEQGRSREGSIVTWTRNSAHTHGEAVDVIVDGSYQNTVGFARLQRIAREEGLRTLGMKDPGHLELAQRDASKRSAMAAAATASNTDVSSAGGSGAAGAAGVARVAGVAGVATVARIADAQTSSRGESGTIGTLAQVQAGRDSHNASSGRDHSQSERQSTSSHGEHRHGEIAGSISESAPAFGASAGSPSATTMSAGTERASAPSSTAGSEQAQRVSDIQQMRADAPAGPLARMTLNVDNANGTQEKITVDLRGNTVSTHISTDAATADRLRLRTAELQDALGRHGLDGDTVKISGSRHESADASRVGLDRDPLRTSTTAAASQEGASGNGQRERAPGERQSSREWQQDSSRREQASQPHDDRQQQHGRQRRPNFLLGDER